MATARDDTAPATDMATAEKSLVAELGKAMAGIESQDAKEASTAMDRLSELLRQPEAMNLVREFQPVAKLLPWIRPGVYNVCGQKAVILVYKILQLRKDIKTLNNLSILMELLFIEDSVTKAVVNLISDLIIRQHQEFLELGILERAQELIMMTPDQEVIIDLLTIIRNCFMNTAKPSPDQIDLCLTVIAKTMMVDSDQMLLASSRALVNICWLVNGEHIKRAVELGIVRRMAEIVRKTREEPTFKCALWSLNRMAAVMQLTQRTVLRQYYDALDMVDPDVRVLPDEKREDFLWIMDEMDWRILVVQFHRFGTNGTNDTWYQIVRSVDHMLVFVLSKQEPVEQRIMKRMLRLIAEMMLDGRASKLVRIAALAVTVKLMDHTRSAHMLDYFEEIVHGLELHLLTEYFKNDGASLLRTAKRVIQWSDVCRVSISPADKFFMPRAAVFGLFIAEILLTAVILVTGYWVIWSKPAR